MTEPELRALLARVTSGELEPDALVDVLREDAPLHAGRSTGATARVRGWVLASFAETGLPERAWPYVREELESGIEPAPVAGAARAVRGGPRDAAVGDLLVRAFVNLRTRDEPVTFDGLTAAWPAVNRTSALREILATAAWLEHTDAARWRTLLDDSIGLDGEVREALRSLAKPRAGGCCGGGVIDHDAADAGRRGTSILALADAIVEDQDGVRTSLGALTLGTPTVLTFFYTRCENPNKCALTIAKLARLQRWLAEHEATASVRVLALTYDPEYDLPARLRRYALDRGLEPGAMTTIGRLPHDHAALRSLLELRVGRGGATINRHAVEVFTLAPDGAVVDVQERRDWDVATVGRLALSAIMSEPQMDGGRAADAGTR